MMPLVMRIKIGSRYQVVVITHLIDMQQVLPEPHSQLDRQDELSRPLASPTEVIFVVTALKCSNLLSTLHAVPYQVPPLPEDMTSFGDDEPLQVATDVDLDYEILRDVWQPIKTDPQQSQDSRLPRTFVDGAVTSVEIAGGVQDGMGYSRSIRAGQLGVGSISLDVPERSRISCICFLALPTMGYVETEIAPLRVDLQNHQRAFELITWGATSDLLLSVARRTRGRNP